MSTFTLIGLVLIILLLGFAVWFLINRAHHLSEYDKELNQRLRSICR